MTPFEKTFTINCLQKIEHILSNKSLTDKAVQHFTQENHQDPRYQSSKITNASSWSEHDKTILTSVISEAIFQITKEMCSDHEQMKQVTTASTLFLNTIVPKITTNTNPLYRLQSVKEQCIKERESLTANPYSFFQVAAGALAVVAFAALAMK